MNWDIRAIEGRLKTIRLKDMSPEDRHLELDNLSDDIEALLEEKRREVDRLDSLLESVYILINNR